jgi:group I intron endonuclease
MVYIGQTINNPLKRWSYHSSKISNSRSYINKAINKHGKNNFKFEVIDSAASIEELNMKEIEWIKYYNSTKTGYNLELGGKNNKQTQETKNKISSSLKLLNKKWTIEQREMMLKIHKGSKRTEDARHKMSQKAKLRSTDHLCAIAPKRKIIDENGIIYGSILSACRLFKISRSCMYKVLNREHKQAKGKIFSYLEDV